MGRTFIPKGKKGKIVTEAEKKKRYEAIELAIESGVLAYKKICKTTKLTEAQLQKAFRENEELHKKYKIALLVVKNKAANNIISMVMDDAHPKNFEATRLFVTRYKTTLDEVFEPQTQQIESDVDIDGTPGGVKVNIHFTSQSNSTENKG